MDDRENCVQMAFRLRMPDIWWRLKIRLPLMMMGLALVSTITMGWASWYTLSQSLRATTIDRLQLMANARRVDIGLIGDRTKADFLMTAENPQVVSNLPDLIENLDPTSVETAAVIAAFRKPRSLVDRIAYDGNDTYTMYARRYAKVQDVARNLLRHSGYADLMFLDINGRIVYTTTKGPEFNKTIADPILRDTGLAHLIQHIRAVPNDISLFEDFAPYPFGDRFSAFIGKQVLRRANVAMNTNQEPELVGYLILRVTPSLFDDILAAPTGLGATEQNFAVGMDGILRSDLDSRGKFGAGSSVEGLGISKAYLLTNNTFAYGTGIDRIAAIAHVTLLGSPWIVVAAQDKTEASKPVLYLYQVLASIGACVLVLMGTLGFFLARSIVRPLAALTLFLKALADRRSVGEVPGALRRDEIGDIATSVTRIRDLTRDEGTQKIEATRLACIRDDEVRHLLLATLAERFDRSIGGIVSQVASTVAELKTSSNVMRLVIDETLGRSKTVNSAACETAKNVNAVAQAAGALGIAAQAINVDMENAAAMSSAAAKDAILAENTMTSLSSAAARIGDIVGLVSTIASQTNLLAINATIEAARAGESGRGFAVVACEVKSLAAQTSRATTAVSDLVNSIREATESASNRIKGIAEQIQSMQTVTKRIVLSVEQQGVTTINIVNSMSEASALTAEMTVGIEEVTKVAEDADLASLAVLQASSNLSQQSGRLTHLIKEFLSNVLAA